MKLDVLIIGAGPTGLFMAEELYRHGLSCKIVDKAISSSPDESRAAAIQPRTLEILAQIGLIDPFLKKGLKVRSASPMFHSKPLTKVSFQYLDSPYPFILSLQQSKTEEILKNHLSSLDIKVRMGTECIDIMQTKESVFATLKDVTTGTEEQVEACYLVGCDGAHSFVRKKLGFSFTGQTFDSVFSLADVCIQWTHSHEEVVAFFSKTGILAAIPLPEKDRYRLIFQLPRCQNNPTEPPPTFEEVQAFLQEHAGDNAKAFDPKWISNFSINARLTSSYRKGRIFLAGDAAHIHSPIGGQGMNTGLQDAFNLAWKLALVHQGKAKSALLKTYHIERHSVAKKVLQGTNRASFFATLQNPIGIFLRNHLISYLGKCSFFQKLLPTLLSQTAIRYPQNLAIFGSKAGKQAPDAPISVEGKTTTLYALWAKKTAFQVLIFSKDQDLQALSLAKDIHAKFSLEPIVISPFPLPKTQEVVLCEDPKEISYKIYEILTPCVYVIRPDGYVGYVGKLSQKKQTIFYLTSWLKESNSKL